MRPERALPAILLAALLLPGCLEQEVTTTIRPDGTCERVIVIQNGGSFPSGIFPIAVDSSWDTSSVRSDPSQHGNRWTLKKEFSSYEALSREYEGDAGPGKIRVTVDVEKHFRWFYTYVEYRETYGRFSPYDLVPPSSVMTEDEILRYTYGDTSAALRQKVDEWEGRNLFEMVYAPMVRRAEQLQNGALVARLAAHKEEAFRILSEAVKDEHLADSLIARTRYRGSADDLFHTGRITDAGVDAMMEMTAQIFRSDSVRQLKEEFRAGWRKMENVALEKLDKQAGSEGFTNTVVMPGLVLETGAPEVRGNMVTWKFGASQLALHDYEMRAESRMVNVWAMAVTGLLVLGLLAFALALPAMLRRRRPVLTPSE